MQFNLQIFEYENKDQFRTIEVDGEFWFVLSDVCNSLDIKSPSSAASRLDDDEKMTLVLTESHSGLPGGPKPVTVISESGLYSLILRSDKPAAKKFKKWVTAEVLPSIRKNGAYGPRKNTPAFIRRYNDNWDRVSNGHFSVISELVIRVWGRFEQVGYTIADKASDGREIRMDVSVGKRFSSWLKDKHPAISDNYSYYLHKTSLGEFPARQYQISVLPQYIEFIDNVYIPEHLEEYIKTRDPKAVAYLPKLLPPADEDKPQAIIYKTSPKKRGS